MRTSRKDDMISLTYLLLYLLNNNELPLMPESFYKIEKNSDIIKRYKMMFGFKEKTPI